MIAARLYRFSAHHSLPGFPEPWCHLHPHRYTIELIGEFNHEDTDDRWAQIGHHYEIANMNDHVSPSTVENLAEHFAGVFNERGITQVKVWEDDDRWGLWEA